MKKHTKIYIEGVGADAVFGLKCEVTGGLAQDVHHISGRGAGGSKLKDTIDNLMALRRDIHDFDESHPHLEWWFRKVHKWFMDRLDKHSYDYAKGYMEVHRYDPFGNAMNGIEIVYPNNDGSLAYSNMGNVFEILGMGLNGPMRLSELTGKGRVTRLDTVNNILTLPDGTGSTPIKSLMSAAFYNNVELDFLDSDHTNLNILNLVPVARIR